MSNSPRAYPGGLQALGLIGLVFGMTIPFSLTDKAFTGLGDFLSTILIIGVPLRYGLKKTGVSFPKVFPLLSPTFSWAVSAFIAWLGLLLVEIPFDEWFSRLLPMPEDFEKEFLEAIVGDKSLWSFLSSVVAAPIMEELFFRGLILRGFLLRYTSFEAIFWSGFLFGVFHVIPWQIPFAILIGFLLGWIRYVTGSLFLPIMIHIVNNGLGMALLLLYPNTEGRPPSFPQAPPFWIALVGAGVLTIGIGLMWRLAVKERKALALVQEGLP